MRPTGSPRLIPLLAALGLSLSVRASEPGWLGAEGPTPPAPGPAGLAALTPELIPYVHPFAAPTRAQLAGHAVADPKAGQVYLLRGNPGVAEPRTNRMTLIYQEQEATRAGYSLLAAPPRGGVPHTPLVGVATFSPPAAAIPTPFMTAVPTSGAKVQVSVLGLEKDSREAMELVLFGSPSLPPAEALVLAARTHGELASTWFPGPTVSRAELAARLGPAMDRLAGHSDEGLVLAVRVLWDTPAGPIPGVGGVLVKAADPSQAFPRLYALYERP